MNPAKHWLQPAEAEALAVWAGREETIVVVRRVWREIEGVGGEGGQKCLSPFSLILGCFTQKCTIGGLFSRQFYSSSYSGQVHSFTLAGSRKESMYTWYINFPYRVGT